MLPIVSQWPHKAAALLILVVALSGCGGSPNQRLMPAAAAPSNVDPGNGLAQSAEFAQMLTARRLKDLGDTNPNATISLVLTLEHRDEAALEKLIGDQETPGTADYQHFLTPQQFDERFGASAQTRSRKKRTRQRGLYSRK